MTPLERLQGDLDRLVPDDGREWPNLIEAVARMHGLDRLRPLRCDPARLPYGGFCRWWGCGSHEGGRLSLLVMEIYEPLSYDFDPPIPRRTFLAFERSWPWGVTA
jgi:hypothetical protein